MKTATKIVSEFGKQGHPLGQSIKPEEASLLAHQLARLLGLNNSELDFSPKSLKLLEDKLVEFSQRVTLEALTEEEIVQMVREVSAYVGEVLVLHTQGKWATLGTLLGTEVVFEENIKLNKEGRTKIIPSIAFRIGFTGAAAVDMAFSGRKPILYRDYLNAKNKSIKEDENA